MDETPLKITALTPDQAAKILSAAAGRRITEGQVRQVVETGDLARADGTFSLIDYTAYLAGEIRSRDGKDVTETATNASDRPAENAERLSGRQRVDRDSISPPS